MNTNFLKLISFVFLFFFLSGSAKAQSVSLPTDRARLKIIKIKDIKGGDSLYVIRTDANTPLRGASPSIEKKQVQLSAIRENFIKDQHNAGMNAIRLIWFEAWQKAAGYDAFTDFNNPAEVEHCLAMLETYVNLCSKYNMYCIINFHSAFDKVYDEVYATQMWTTVAAYFKDRTHVAFETANEPSNNFSTWYGNSEMQKYANIYNLVKSVAPNSMQFVLTPNRLPDSYPTAIDLADKLSSLGSVDWTNTVVAYHLYGGSLLSIRNLHKKYPALPSENNFPANSGANKDPWGGVSLDGDYYSAQTCEKLGIGWLHWAITNDCNCYEGWYANWPIMLSDALNRGWYWESDTLGEKDSIAPNAPNGLKMNSVTASRASISWTVPTDNIGVLGYEIFVDGKSVGKTALSKYTIKALLPETNYKIRIKARDLAGNWSIESGIIDIKTQLNIALSKTVTASSISSASYQGNKAVDGNSSTQWRSSNNDTKPAITVDLGGKYSITNIFLDWGINYGKSYQVEVSDDGIIFSVAKSLYNQNGAEDEILGLAVSGRYLRITVTSLSLTNSGVYLKELEIYGINLSTSTSFQQTKDELFFYPNPAVDWVVIGNALPTSAISIYSIVGERVFHEEVIAPNKLVIDISKMKSGLYLIENRTENYSVTKKIIIKK